MNCVYSVNDIILGEERVFMSILGRLDRRQAPWIIQWLSPRQWLSPHNLSITTWHILAMTSPDYLYYLVTAGKRLNVEIVV